MSRTITLNGITYAPVDLDRGFTVEYDIHVMDTWRAAGLDTLVVPDDLPPEEKTRLVLTHLADRPGMLAQLAACSLAPVDDAWTPAWATATGAALEVLPTAAERRAVIHLALTGLDHFFRAGGRFALISS